MSIKLKPGARLFSPACTAEFITVKAPTTELELTIGGLPALLSSAARTAGAQALAGHDGGAAIGKRYVDGAASIELLCTKPGPSVPAVDGELLVVQGANPLPASD